jgi:hypothetical protein
MTVDLNARILASRATAPREKAGAAPPAHRAVRPSGPARTRWALLNGIVDGKLRELGDAETRVWLVLYRDERDGLARTGMTDIARRAGLSRRGVVKAVKGLKARGIIEVTARGTIAGMPNTYRLKTPT